jgi:hypothetical protein
MPGTSASGFAAGRSVAAAARHTSLTLRRAAALNSTVSVVHRACVCKAAARMGVGAARRLHGAPAPLAAAPGCNCNIRESLVAKDLEPWLGLFCLIMMGSDCHTRR